MKKYLYTKKEILALLDEHIACYQRMYEHSRNELDMPDYICDKYFAHKDAIEILKNYIESH